MFYIVSKQGMKIIDAHIDRPTLEELKVIADECHLDLYVIEGERTGMEYERPFVALDLPDGFKPPEFDVLTSRFGGCSCGSGEQEG